MTSRYDEIYARSLAEPEAFWAEAAEGIDWEKRWDRVLDDSRPPFNRWFVGAEVNTCHNALDRHVAAGRGAQTALIYDSPVTGTVRSFTYAELQALAARFAGALSAGGVGRGDRVVLYMPMVPEAAIAMLACARIGAVHSVVFGGFAANELATRIDDAKPKIVVCGSCGIEGDRVIAYKPLLDAAIELASHKPERCIVLQRPELEAPLTAGRDETWGEAMAGAEPADCVPVAATDPLYILYTSGTTGDPKGIVRDNGGHLVALNWTMSGVYNRAPGQVWWAASDIGWVVGHSYIVYAPLIYGCPSILYEGKPVGTPDAGAYWRVISQHGVSAMFTAPTAFRAIKRDDPDATRLADYDISCFDTLYLAGERTDPDTLAWAEGHLERTRLRPLVADRIRLAHGRQLCRPRRAAGEARLADQGGAGLSHRGGGRGGARRCQRAASARSWSSCRCRPALRRRSGTMTSASRRRISRASPATTSPAMPASSTRTAISGS